MAGPQRPSVRLAGILQGALRGDSDGGGTLWRRDVWWAMGCAMAVSRLHSSGRKTCGLLGERDGILAHISVQPRRLLLAA
jgi:hypothetical protein